MKNLETIFSEEFISALGWTLLHSLWQGALVALLLGVTLLFLQKKSSVLRYNLSAAALVVTLVAFMGTFFYLYQDALVNATDAVENSVIVILQNNYENITETSQEGLFGVFVDYFNHHLPIIVVLWLLGVLVLSLRFLGGLAYLERLKYSNNRPIEVYWQERLEAIRQQVGVKKSIELLESALVKVPMVVGYLKPIILLPIGTVNALSAAEVEAILAHELAHIRRHDYIINLIQSVIDVLFFYHPAVWWMSNAVRAERENCCDDLALSVTGNSLIIAKALANLEAFRVHTANLSLAFTGNKNQLFNRISRLLGQPMKKNNHFIEGIIAIFIIIICLTTINYNVNASSDLHADHLVAIDTTEPMNTVLKVESIVKEEEDGEVIEEYIIIEEEIEVEDNSFFFAPAPTSSANIAYFESVAPVNVDNSWFFSNNSNINLTAPNFQFEELENFEEINLLVEPNGKLDLSKVTPNVQEFKTYTFSMEDNAFDGLLEIKAESFKGSNRVLQFKSNTDNALKFEPFISNVDTSILDKLDFADVIFIDGDKTIIIRKKKDKRINAEKYARVVEGRSTKRAAKLEKEMAKREAEMFKIQAKREKEMAKRQAEIAKVRAEREKEIAKRMVEREKRVLKLQGKIAKEEAKRAEESTQREYEIAIRQYEKEAERKQRQLELAESRALERIQRQEEQLARQQEQIARQEARIAEEESRRISIKMQNKDKIKELLKKQMEEIKSELVKDGILKEGQRIKTINVKEHNGGFSLKVNGKRVPKNKAKKYQDLMRKHEKEVKALENKDK